MSYITCMSVMAYMTHIHKRMTKMLDDVDNDDDGGHDDDDE